MRPEPFDATLYHAVTSGLAVNLGNVLLDLLPGGKIEGMDYVCASFSGGSGNSCKTNIISGEGADDATGATWGDIIGLVQRMRNVNAHNAALWLAERYGIPTGQPDKKESELVFPVPSNAPPRLEQHHARGVPVAWWEYRDRNDQLLHYVARFESATDTIVLPQCLFRNEHGELVWLWQFIPGPRPLYGLGRLASMPSGTPVLLVKDEKTADAAQRLFPGYVCMTWSGGAIAICRADVSPLRGRNVFIWLDNDERGRGTGRYAHDMLTAAGAYPLLLPLPDFLPDKWDLADAPPEGFDPVAYLGRAGLPSVSLPVAPFDDAVRPWPVLQPEALSGLAGEFVIMATRDSEADPFAVLITFLTRFGAEVHGFTADAGPYVWVGETWHPPRVYAVIAGASSRARKGTSAKPVLRAFAEVPPRWRNGPPVAPYTGGPLSSGEGLAYRLRERDNADDAEQGERERAPAQSGDKRLYVLDEELASAMATMKREGNTLSMALRSFWDSGDYEPLTKTSQVKVQGAHVCIVTHITIREVRRNLDAMQIANGFANRFLWICARRTKLVPCPEAIPHAEFEVFRNILWERIRLAQSRGEMCFTWEAAGLWKSVYPYISKDEPGASGDITARGEAHCIRLALIYALLDGADRIEAAHLRAALALWRYARDSALYIFGNGEEDDLLRKVLLLLQSGPKSTTELNDLFGGHLSSRRIQSCLQELVGCGLIVKQEVKTGGRPKILYQCTEKAENGDKQ